MHDLKTRINLIGYRNGFAGGSKISIDSICEGNSELVNWFSEGYEDGSAARKKLIQKRAKHTHFPITTTNWRNLIRSLASIVKMYAAKVEKKYSDI